MMNMNNKSFTLIELLVVIVIIGILAGVIMISTSSSIDKANIAKIKVFEESVQNNLAANMISKWDFNNVSGTINTSLAADTAVSDKWGNNSGLSKSGPVLKDGSDCINGKCLLFNGTNYILLNSQNSLTSFTYSIWINKSMDGEYIPSGLNGNNYVLDFYDGTDRIYTANSSNVSWASQILDNNKWYYITLAREDTSIRLYTNGAYQDSKTLSTNTPHQFQKIGCTDSAGWFFKGMIDELSLYDSALSQANIKKDYIAGLDSLVNNQSMSKEEYDQRINELAYE